MNRQQAEQLAQQLQDMGFSIESEFIPFSRSRNKDEKNPSLNWLVTLKYNDRDVLTTDYASRQFGILTETA